MKLAISNIGCGPEMDPLLYQTMGQMGFSGLEIAPTRIFPQTPYDHLEEASDWAKSLFRDFGFTISSMQSIWYGRKEKLFGSVEEREILSAYTMKAVDFAEAVGCGNLVFGSPVNRSMGENDDPEQAVPFFKKLGDYAKRKGTVIAIEANPVIYNTNFLNDTLSALDFVESVGSDGFRVNLDAGTMIANNEDINKIYSRAHLINHVHISEPHLKCLQKRSLHQELAAMLRNSGYDGFVSIEVGRQDSAELLTEMMAYVREIFG